MRVLKHGRKQHGWAKELQCTGAGNEGGGCGALLLVEQDDLFQTTRNCRDETESFATFRCPECGVLTDLGPGQSPIHSSRLKKDFPL